MARLLQEQQPDIVHVHNVYPLISPSILTACGRASVPVVMTVHNYRLLCANSLFLCKNHICELCSGSSEYHCLINNCESDILKSAGYALRNYVARRLRLFKNNVAAYITLSEFQRCKMTEAGFSSQRVVSLPHMLDSDGVVPADTLGDYVGFVGRISHEKGIAVLAEAAQRCSDVTFRAAGRYREQNDVSKNSPVNLIFAGHLTQPELNEFYAAARMIVLPSLCYETFGLSVAEAMLRGKPVICSRIGGLGELVEDGITGLLFEPGNSDELAEKTDYLWHRPDLCRQMGHAGRERILQSYAPQQYYDRLMALYTGAQATIGPRSVDEGDAVFGAATIGNVAGPT